MHFDPPQRGLTQEFKSGREPKCALGHTNSTEPQARWRGWANVGGYVLFQHRVIAADSKAVAASIRPSANSIIHRAWPPAVLVLGLVVTCAWTTLLLYGLFRVAQSAF